MKKTQAFASATGDHFNGFFSAGKKRTFHKSSLMDARARGVFEMMTTACEAGVYPYQIALEGRTGPWTFAEGRQMLMMSSYDYLGLIGDDRVDDAGVEAVRKYGTGTGGARMLTGTIDLHHELEMRLAKFKRTEAAITFTSGYLANLAVMSGLLTPQDRVVMDTLVHRSIVDACRLAGVQIQRFRHNDMASLRKELEGGQPANRTMIVVDGVFSMDGDICPLPEVIAIKKEFNTFLMVDDSHAFGVIGECGRGTDEHFGILTSEVDVYTGSLGKAIPSTGGWIATSQEIAIYLQHAAAPFIFSGALCPAAAGAALEGIRIIQSEPERVERLASNAAFLRDGLRNLGYDTGLSETAVIPVILPDEPTAALFAGRLRDLGLLVSPIMFPAVPLGTARLRLCATAAHTVENLEFCLGAFAELQ